MILEDIFSFERDPMLGRLLFIGSLVLISLIVAIHEKVHSKDGDNEEERNDNNNS